MSENESDDDDEASGRKSNKLLTVVLIVLSLCLLLLIAAIIAAFFIKGINSKSKNEEDHRFALLTAEERTDTSFDDVVDICSTKQRKLPVPKNEEDERALIDEIKVFHKTSKCDSYLLGYKLDPSVRYQSTDGKMKWPPLRVAESAAIPNPGRDCALVKLKSQSNNFEVVSSSPCDKIVQYNCVVGYALPEEYCQFRRHWCLYAVDVLGVNPNEMFDSFKKNLIRHDKLSQPYGILLIDRKHLALDISNLTFPDNDACYALEVDYVLKYRDIYSSDSIPYKMNITVHDPEMECLAVSKDTFEIETVPCGRSACALCE